MERKTFSIMFFIKRTRLNCNQEAPVILRITVNGERADTSIQVRILRINGTVTKDVQDRSPNNLGGRPGKVGKGIYYKMITQGAIVK